MATKTILLFLFNNSFLFILAGLDCWDGVDSKTYSGNVSVTQSGYVCQDWAAQQPHAHNLTETWKYPCDGSMTAALNRCRDPDWTGTPWCHTTDIAIRRERCNVTICPTRMLFRKPDFILVVLPQMPFF